MRCVEFAAVLEVNDLGECGAGCQTAAAAAEAQISYPSAVLQHHNNYSCTGSDACTLQESTEQAGAMKELGEGMEEEKEAKKGSVERWIGSVILRHTVRESLRVQRGGSGKAPELMQEK